MFSDSEIRFTSGDEQSKTDTDTNQKIEKNKKSDKNEKNWYKWTENEVNEWLKNNLINEGSIEDDIINEFINEFLLHHVTGTLGHTSIFLVSQFCDFSPEFS